MFQLREFAQHKTEFDRSHTVILAISTDSVKDARATWQKAVRRSFPVLSARGSDVLESYGLLQAGGDDGKSDDIAIRTTLLVDQNGREIWRYVSETANDFPRATWVLERLQQNNQ